MPLVSAQTSCDQPKVSVAMLAYNHERFIMQAIESVLMQETDFPIELVIGEDCSTDATREIVKKFAAHYPNVIRTILHERNVGMHRNSEAVGKACRGHYIACLEGDDYWTCPHKLQKQVNFLDQHPDYSLCGHRVMHIFDKCPECSPHFSPVQEESGTIEDILRWNYLPSCSVVYRAGLLAELPAWLQQLPHGDWPLWVLLAERGRIGFFNEIMAHYRVHEGGVWMGAPLQARLASLRKTIHAIHRHLPEAHREARRCALFTLNLSGARDFANHAACATSCRYLACALLSHPLAFARSVEVRALLQKQYDYFFVQRGIQPLKQDYYRARIWLGAKRRAIVNSLKSAAGR